MSKKAPRTKTCWVKDCKEPQDKDGWLCDKHRKMSEKGHYLQMKTVGIQPFDNTPGKY